MQISCALKNVKSFLGAFPSDLLPHSINVPSTIILNTDNHTQTGTHRLAIHLEPRSSTAFYFDSYGLTPDIPDIQSFLRRNCTVLSYINAQLQGPLSTVCGKYCCLFALYMDRGITSRQFVGLFTPGLADQQVEDLFAYEFGSVRRLARGGQCCVSRCIKGEFTSVITLFYHVT
jgi:hypothetical protein